MSFFSKLFGGGASQSQTGEEAGGERVPRRSNGLAELTKYIQREGSCTVLDLGPTSPTNITYFTNLGARSYTEDVLRSSQNPEYLVKNSDGKTVIDPDKFLTDNLNFDAGTFDAVLCWDTPDYMNEALVKPVIQRIHKVMKPGGLVLAFFHTKDAGPDATYYRYHIAGQDALEMQPIARSSNSHFKLQRVFNNRHIENLFHDYGSIKFFLGRDNIREVLIVR
jgi:SAM-dependent methyltransferase